MFYIGSLKKIRSATWETNFFKSSFLFKVFLFTFLIYCFCYLFIIHYRFILLDMLHEDKNEIKNESKV